MNSEDIKIALLSNYRYKKQSIAADEVGFILGNTDISVYTESNLTEIEIKTSKSDLWHGEKAKQKKHDYYKAASPEKLKNYYIPNYFYICVPTSLVDEAKKWVLTINEKYGILEYQHPKDDGICWPRPEDRIYVAKRAKSIHTNSHPKSLEKIARRLSSANINLRTSLKIVSSRNKEYWDEIQKLKEEKSSGH